jgi:AraC-like DNA-binding protein
MRTLKQFEPLVIHDFTEKVFHMESHGHTYFEIGYIYKGTGTHFLNNSILEYQSGDIFLVCPQDSHTFNIRKRTRFVFIKFTESYFSLFDFGQHHAGPLVPIELMNTRALKENKLEIKEPQSTILKNTIDSIVAFDRTSENIINSMTIYHQILSILALVRDVLGKTELSPTTDALAEPIISYIHQHIYSPPELKISNVSAQFNVAPKYFSAYFKRVYGIGYSQYINKYKAALIELRFESKQFTIKQVAEEFGFTDESHLSRFFKKFHTESPGAYKNIKRPRSV